MAFISSKQAALQWNISPRRVVMLATQGRIEGAVLMDNRWLIPEDAPKPADSRTRETKQAQVQANGEHFVYPFIMGVVHSEEQVDRFTPDEKELYRMCLLFEEGLFDEARQAAEGLLGSQSTWVVIGALYMLVFICAYQKDVDASEKYSLLFRTAVHQPQEHREELMILYNLYQGEMGNVTAFAEGVNYYDISAFDEDMTAVLCIQKALEAITVPMEKGVAPNITLFELICRQLDCRGYWYCALYIHMVLSLFYAVSGEKEQEYKHTKRALELGLQHNALVTLAYMLINNPEAADAVLAEYPPEVAERFMEITELCTEMRTRFAEYHGRATTFSQLKRDDYRLISCCLKGYTVEQMAAVFGLSKSGMNRRLAKVYERLGVRTKKEMIAVYLDFLKDWSHN